MVNENETSVRQLPWKAIVITTVVTVILTCILTDLYQQTKNKVSYAMGMNTLNKHGALTATIIPETRYISAHKFIGIGHTHYFTNYSLRLSNRDYTQNERPTLSISCPNACITDLVIPPILKAKNANGALISNMTWIYHGKGIDSLILDLDAPPINMEATILITIETMDKFYEDTNLKIDLKYTNELIQLKCPKSSWSPVKDDRK